MKKIARRPSIQSELFSDSIHPALQRIYSARGIASSEDLDLRLNGLIPAQQLKGLDSALVLLYQALLERWSILIVGDFDADGAVAEQTLHLVLEVPRAPLLGLERLAHHHVVDDVGVTVGPEICRLAGHLGDEPELSGGLRSALDQAAAVLQKFRHRSHRERG